MVMQGVYSRRKVLPVTINLFVLKWVFWSKALKLLLQCKTVDTDFDLDLELVYQICSYNDSLTFPREHEHG